MINKITSPVTPIEEVDKINEIIDDINNGVGANKDLSNLTSTGQNIANWSSNVTNCITEIPQDIKLELNNGTLTLKAGSKVYVPNGVGVFDVVTISSDLTASTSGTASKLLFYNRTTNALDHWNTGACKSGTAWSGVEGVFYNTSMNTIKYTVNSGSTWNAEYSLPIGIATTDGGFVSIDQVFNGFGYIGSTVFALPGVKSLCPNGKNNDDTIKSNRKIQNNIAITTFQNGITIPYAKLIYRPNTVGDVDLFYVDDWDFNNKTGFIEVGGVSVNKGSIIILGNISINSGYVTKLITKTAFHALDYSDSSTISGWSMPSSRYIDLTLGASGTTYTAPANGYVAISKQSNGSGQYLQLTFSDQVQTLYSIGSGYRLDICEPVKKGRLFNVNYSVGGSTEYFRFIYAKGEN